MKLSVIFFICIAQTWALLPNSYTSSFVNKNDNIEPLIRRIIEENLDAFHLKLQKTIWNDFTEWMSYNENFIASKFASHQLEMNNNIETLQNTMIKILLDIKKGNEEHKHRKHHKRNVTHNIEKREDKKITPIALSELLFPKSPLALSKLLSKSDSPLTTLELSKLLSKSKNTSENGAQVESKVESKNTSENGARVESKVESKNTSENGARVESKVESKNTSENGAEFVDSDYDDFGESIPFFSSTVPPPNYTLRNYFKERTESIDDKKLKETIDSFLQ